ncbi:MAG: T9SS type A sorting domain-containing protein [Bacteroidota bacterium]
MRYFILLTFLCFSSLQVQAQCLCDPLPPDQGTIVTVNDVQSLQQALSAASQNNGNYTILLESGTYSLSSNLLYIGTHMNNLTIRGVSGNRDDVIIEGQGMNGGVSHIFNVAADNFTVADMTIGWVANHPIQIHAEHDADNSLVRNVRFVDANEQMLKVSGSSSSTYSDNGRVECCLFEFPAGQGNQWYTGGIDAHRARNWEVRYNTFRNIKSPDSGLSEHAIHFWSLSENTLVENNLIINCDRGIGFGLGNSSTQGHYGGIIRNNIIHTTRDVGIGLERSRNTKIYNNTIHTLSYFNSIEYRFDSTYNAHIVNNLVNENIVSRNGGMALVENNHTFTGTSIFNFAAGHDYHLATSIPEIVNQGMVLSDVGMDYDCETRTMGGAPDIGADEWFEEATSIDNNFEDESFSIYPNPFNNYLTVESIDHGELKITDVSGKEIYTALVNDHTEMVHNLEPLPTGVYIVIFSTEQITIFRKLVKH